MERGMKVVILAGGKGTRLAEYTDRIPKPMIEIGGYPMLYHIMKIYANYGYNEFIIAGGYKQEVIKEWLDNAYIPWNVELVDTGLESKTGLRVLKLEKRLIGPFMLTYGDGMSDVDLNKLLDFHTNRH
jgi:glucose-1-phosphate cytidylyltransferase